MEQSLTKIFTTLSRISLNNRSINLNIDEQFICDKCPLIPRIVDLDEKSGLITIKCENHGYKQIFIEKYFKDSYMFNNNNYSCSICNNIQKYYPDKTLYAN